MFFSRIKKYPAVFICLFCLFPLFLFGQGAIKGVVVDGTDGEYLTGANIILQNTSIGTATDIDGIYKISLIPAGSHIVEVIYIGYKTQVKNIEIADGDELILNFEIVPDLIEGETIVISAQATGQISAINQQIQANTIVNIISEEKIKELPDANAAESIGRLPGVSLIRAGGEASKVVLRGMEDKFTAITIDGVRIPATDETGRGVDLSSISQNSLAGIELAKAITPDKDGDALAGSVNLVTKKAPEKRAIRTNTKGVYNNLEESANQYDLSVHYGERFFDNILGVQLAGNIEKKIRSNERIDVDYQFDAGDSRKYPIDNFKVQYTDEIRLRNGFSVLLDINTPDDGSIKINNVYGGTTRDYLWHSRDYPTPGPNGGDAQYDYRQREQDINTFNSSISGNNRLLGFGLNWGFSFAESKSDFPFDYQLTFREGDPIQAGYDKTYDYKQFPNRIIPRAKNNFGSANLYWAQLEKQDNYEKERTAYFNMSREYTFLSNLSGEIKVGGKFKTKDRTNESREDFTPYYLGNWKSNELAPDNTILPKDFSGSYFEDWANAGGGFIPVEQFFANAESRDVYGEYILQPLVEKERLKQWQKLNKNGVDVTGNIKEIWRNPLIRYDDYNITENVSAFYLMNTLKIGQQITFISGLRTEHEYNDYDAFYMLSPVGGFPIEENALRDTASTAQQTVYLPNFHLAYAATDYLKIRLAAYKALARPDFNMRIDRYIAGRPASVGSNFQALVGNIGLKTAQAWNYELNTSVYSNDIGLVSVSVFYKEIKDMFHMLNRYGATGDSALHKFGIEWDSKMGNRGYLLTLPYNSEKPTKVWGLEFEHQINFHFLPGYLKNIVLSYNASIVRTETYVFGAKIDSAFIDPPGPIGGYWTKFNVLDERRNKLEGQPEFFGNISLGYDIADFSGRISLFHQAEYNNAYSATRQSYQINKAFTRIDLALKQRITEKFSVFLNVNNLTNAEEGNYNYDGLYDIKYFNRSEKYGTTIDFGIFGEF